MPFYEYHCANCGHHHEELQKVTDRPLRKCPACGLNKLNRLISAPVFRLKGGGWYETDFKSDQEARRNLAGEKEPAGSKSEAAEKPKEPVKPKESASQDKGAKPSGKAAAPVPKPARAARKAPGRKPRAAGRRAK